MTTRRKRTTPSADVYAEEEAAARRTNVNSLAVLGAHERAVRHLEELVLGAVHAQDEEEERKSRDDDDDEEEEETLDRLQPPPIKRAAWIDEDDELDEEVDMKHRFRSDLMRGDAESTMTKQKLQQRMREQFQKSMGGAPSWAIGGRKLTTDDEEEEEEEDKDDDLLRRTGTLVASSDVLPSGVLKMKKCLHANAARPSEDRLTSVQFHPTAQVVMTAGLDCSLSLFQVDGKTNAKIQSVHLDRFPVHKACFSRHGDTVIATSLKNKMFYVYDMMEGRVTPVHTVRGLNEARVKEFSVCPDGGALLLTGSRGYLHTLTLKTKEVVSSMKMNGDVSGVAFSRDGSKVFANSEEGEVYVWDVRSSRCLSKFADDGCVRATSIATSPNGQYLACGSQAGVVNVYLQEACLNSASPRPLKAMMNLLTSATSLTFNPTSEILAMASRAEDEGVRLVHVASLSVFSNFPVSKRKSVHRASCLHFSPHSGFFSLANNKGHAPLFRLLHYTSF
ncbi:U3 small nucleolar RNA-associated protein 18 homolog isoform X2 [Dunckerocampus dactyliophorus]|uniref:U3 small nucleolar RNA-associated protein 18 homolog isoform X2 n=1 Tax=Dunckerocampus dactyliophorus TaxID=161453 RepID=UPI0024052048|nr:U3 small nucleolar RNA-associated protein 18 homolog isoform X2 [Dunckerocampus dactyliophorus]